MQLHSSHIIYFNPRSPCGERPGVSTSTGMSVYKFQSTLPMRGATRPVFPLAASRTHFNPRSPCGERPAFLHRHCIRKDFNPRSPCGERLLPAPRSSCGAPISIHAPHAGSDLPFRAVFSTGADFNPRSPCGERLDAGDHPDRPRISIHAPHAGSDVRPILRSDRAVQFQSTLPMRGATAMMLFTASSFAISIHAPHAGSD